jgi:hypothetical protein
MDGYHLRNTNRGATTGAQSLTLKAYTLAAYAHPPRRASWWRTRMGYAMGRCLR